MPHTCVDWPLSFAMSTPSIVLTHSPQDYMEDHTNTSRLAVTAAFSRGMPNLDVEPPRPPVDSEVTVYHAMPHGLMDELRRPVQPDLLIDTTAVFETKRQALAAHRSQKEWLDVSQGMDSYLKSMEEMSRKLGQAAGTEYAEGWRRHSHLGFSAREMDPLGQALGQGRTRRAYRSGVGHFRRQPAAAWPRWRIPARTEYAAWPLHRRCADRLPEVAERRLVKIYRRGQYGGDLHDRAQYRHDPPKLESFLQPWPEATQR